MRLADFSSSVFKTLMSSSKMERARVSTGDLRFKSQLIIIITFMQDTYNYIPEKNIFLGYIILHLFCDYSLCSVRCCTSRCVTLADTLRSMCAVPYVAVFSSSLMSWFPRMLLRYYLSYRHFSLLLLSCRSQWPRDLRRGSASARLLGRRVWILPVAWMSLMWVSYVVR
jgi:hypothetical protein